MTEGPNLIDPFFQLKKFFVCIFFDLTIFVVDFFIIWLSFVFGFQKWQINFQSRNIETISYFNFKSEDEYFLGDCNKYL